MNVESTCIFISGSYDANCVCSDHAEMYITILIPSFPYGPIKKSYRILFRNNQTGNTLLSVIIRC